MEPAGKGLPVVSLRAAAQTGEEPWHVAYPVDTWWHELVEFDPDENPDHLAELREGGNGRWTSDWPCERYQQEKEVQDFQGTVIVGGLGIGMITKVIADLPAVKRVVTVEVEPDVVALVSPHIQADADLEFVCSPLDVYLWETDETFDFAFYDIWRSDGAWTLYATVWPLRRLSWGRGLLDHRIRNWNEDVMRGQILSGVMFGLANLEMARRGVKDRRPEVQGMLKGLWYPTAKRAEAGDCAPDHLWFWRQFFKREWDQGDMEFQLDKAREYARSFGTQEWEQVWEVDREDFEVVNS